MKRALALLAFLAGWLVLGATPASAHVEIISSTPGDGARLSAAPSQVSVTLSENVGIQPGSIKVVDLAGREVVAGPVFQPGDVAEQVAVQAAAEPARTAVTSSNSPSSRPTPTRCAARSRLSSAPARW